MAVFKHGHTIRKMGRNDTEVVADFVGKKIDGGFDDASNFDSFDNTNQGENIPF